MSENQEKKTNENAVAPASAAQQAAAPKSEPKQAVAPGPCTLEELVKKGEGFSHEMERYDLYSVFDYDSDELNKLISDLEETVEKIVGRLEKTAKEGNASDQDPEKLRNAVKLVASRPKWSEKWEDLMVLITEDFHDKKEIGAWTRALSGVYLSERERRELVQVATKEHFHYYLEIFNALEEEMDKHPGPETAEWYVSLLELEPPETAKGKILNRLAYYHLLNHILGDRGFDKAKAYFRALERRGITFKNTFPGYYGSSNWDRLVDAVLGDVEASEVMIPFMEMTEGALVHISETGLVREITVHGNDWYPKYDIETDDVDAKDLISMFETIETNVAAYYKFLSRDHLTDEALDTYEGLVLRVHRLIRSVKNKKGREFQRLSLLLATLRERAM